MYVNIPTAMYMYILTLACVLVSYGYGQQIGCGDDDVIPTDVHDCYANYTNRGLNQLPSDLPYKTTFLNLAGNNFQTLNIDILARYRYLQRIDLQGNPLRCDCDLRWLYYAIKNRYRLFSSLAVDGAVCQTPTNLANRPLSSLSLSDFNCGDVDSHRCYTCLSSENTDECTRLRVSSCQPFQDRCKVIEFQSGERSYSHLECAASTNCPSDTNLGLGPCHGTGDDRCAVHCCEGDLCNVFLPLTLIPKNNTIIAEVTTAQITTRVQTTINRLTTTVPKTTRLETQHITSQPSTPKVVTTHAPTPTCAAETTANDKGIINWPESQANAIVYRKCPHQSLAGTDDISAERQCILLTDNMAAWNDPNTTGCRAEAESSTTDRLHNLANITIPPEQVETASYRLNILTTEAESFDETDVELTVDVVDNLLKSMESDITDSKVAENILQTVGNLFKVDREVLRKGQEDQNVGSRMLEAVEQLSRTITVKNNSVSMETDEILLTVAAVNISQFEGLAFSSKYNPKFQRGNHSRERNQDKYIKPTIKLPPSLFVGLNDEEKTEVSRVQFIAYRSNVLFEIMGGQRSWNKPQKENQTITEDLDNRNISTWILASPVISASVGQLEISNIKDPVEIAFADVREEYSDLSCVFWNTSINDGEGGWSDNGCVLMVNKTSSDQPILCHCNHLTNFALLMDVYNGGGDISDIHQQTLSIISYVGCAISMCALVVTLINLIIFGRKRDNPTRIMMNLCFALTMTLALFLIGAFYMDFAPTIPVLCQAIAAFLHYFLLAVLTWMALEAVQMYLMVIRVFKLYISHFMLKFCLIGWGLPAVVVGITIGVDLDNYGYINNICWLSRYAFYGAFLAPVCLVVLFNSIVYCLVIKQLCSLRSKKLTVSERFSTTAQLRAAMGLLVLLGLTWILAIFAVGEASLVFQYLFAVCNSLQGFFIFIFHCVLNKEIQKRWRRMCRCNWASYRTVDSSLMSGSTFTSEKYQVNVTDDTAVELDVTPQAEVNCNPCYDNGDLCTAEMKTFKEDGQK